ncbi:MAG: polynucleotide kinase [Catenulispora sp.]|nr:polynucleotide kinase [Catenulispora sp.]
MPLSIYSYSRTCQYDQYWTPVTTRTRGLVVDDTTGRVAGWCLPKFFNHGQHGKFDYAPPLPDEPFEVYDKVDGSLGIVFHYDGAWRAASKGSFVSDQAAWAQRYLDQADTSALDTAVTYLAEIVYPENRIVVNYGDRRDLVLLAAFRADGTELPLRAAAPAWQGVGTVVRTYDWTDTFGVLAALAEKNQHLDGADATGTDAEGWVIRFASGVRTKTKLTGYVSLHYRLTSITPKHIWRALAVQRHPEATDVQLSQAIGVQPNEVVGMRRIPGGPLAPLLEDVPDEYDAWVRSVCDDLTARAAALAAKIEGAHASLTHLAGDRGAYARAAKDFDGFVRAGMFLLLDGRPIALHVWRAVKPEAAEAFRDDDEG